MSVDPTTHGSYSSAIVDSVIGSNFLARGAMVPVYLDTGDTLMIGRPVRGSKGAGVMETYVPSQIEGGVVTHGAQVLRSGVYAPIHGTMA